VTVAAGAVARHDVRLPRRVRVEGRVTQGVRPLAGAEIEIYPIAAQQGSWRIIQGEDWPRSDATGAFAIDGVMEGRYAVLCSIGEFTVLSGTVDRAREAPVRVPLELGTYAVRVKVVDAGGKPLTAAEPEVWRQGGADWEDCVRSRDMEELRRADGVYVLPYVKPGRWCVQVNAGDAHAEGGPVEVGPASPEPLVVVRLEPRGTLVVRVVDRQGRPAAGVQIRIEHPTGTPGYSYPTDGKGEHRRDLTAQAWRVGLADRPGWLGEPLSVEVKADQENVVELVVK
jgi:hypothetical protein